MLSKILQSSVGPCELSVFQEQQDFHAWPIVDAGSHYRLQVKSYPQGMKEQHHVGTCRQEHQVCNGFVGLEASAFDRVDRL